MILYAEEHVIAKEHMEACTLLLAKLCGRLRAEAYKYKKLQ